MTNTSINAPYYDIGQLRIELWTQLKRETARLAGLHRDSTVQDESAAAVERLLGELQGIEHYFAFPGLVRLDGLRQSLKRGEFNALANRSRDLIRLLVSDSYRSHPEFLEDDDAEDQRSASHDTIPSDGPRKNYFEVLFVDDLSVADEVALRDRLRGLREPDDQFVYDAVVQRSFQDALIASLVNHNIQAVVVRYAPPYHSTSITPAIEPYIQDVLRFDYANRPDYELGPILGRLIRELRPQIDRYYVTDTALNHLKESTLSSFRRIFYRRDDLQELHFAILRGIRERYITPFFGALREFSQKPTGVFHAMPISRGNSVFKSRWIRDFGDFYRRNMFMAETSATTGGLDSLLQPTGPLKRAQEQAAEAYGAQHTFFVTNGTSTANKIVLQALVEPGDLALVDRDCHKSHHYGLVLTGAHPVYLDSYPIREYSMYGAVPLEVIREKLLMLKRKGRLDKVKILLLTNCTFDGLVYNVERIMEMVLSIKPDIVFLWDEAWFAFAGFTYCFRRRTAMHVAHKLYHKYRGESYRKEYEEHCSRLGPGEEPSLPNPDTVKIRVYSTQSTHKTLTSFRQGSMIHVWDEDFRRITADAFQEAYLTHTSTSPNYQILASLDISRRQVQFEGYEMVERCTELAMVLRATIEEHPRLSTYFDVLKAGDLIPDNFRQSGLAEYYRHSEGWNRMEEAWATDEFVLDPTKITLSIGRTGVDGDTFKNRYLMDRFNIQINKTSRNSVLLMTNIGTTRGSVAYLINALLRITDELEGHFRSLNRREMETAKKRIQSLTTNAPPLPDFSRFHSSFQDMPGVPGGDLRQAYFLSYREDSCEYIALTQCLPEMETGRELVSASFVIPYPPGFPVLVPGQVMSREIIEFMLALDVKEIHGYRPDLGLKIFTEKALNRERTVSAMSAMGMRRISK